MREYAKVEPKMWHGETFKALRKRGSEGVVVGLYLMTSPMSNMLGLFSQPVLYMAHETGLGEQGALKGLRDCIEVGFCSYDEASEVVWVHEMAKYQIAADLKATDLRCKGIQKDYDAMSENPFLGAFFDMYSAAFHMTNRRGSHSPIEGASKAPTKPLRSQEQEQEQEQELFVPSGTAVVQLKPISKRARPCRFPEFWEAWPSTPRKVAKAECEKRWKARGLDEHAEAIVAHVAAMRGTEQWQKGFEPAPLTYLNQRRWEDGEGSADLLSTSHGNRV